MKKKIQEILDRLERGEEIHNSEQGTETAWHDPETGWMASVDYFVTDEDEEVYRLYVWGFAPTHLAEYGWGDDDKDWDECGDYDDEDEAVVAFAIIITNSLALGIRRPRPTDSDIIG